MPATHDFDRLIAIGIATLFALFVARCLVGAALYALAAVPGAVGSTSRRLARVVTPRLVRRLAIIGFAAGTAGIGAVPAMATTIDRGPLPAESVKSGSTPAEMPDPGHQRATPRTVTVRTGDCLWSLAQAHLPQGASTTQIDHEWRRWYRVNRDRIGSDPDLLADGVALLVPTGVAR